VQKRNVFLVAVFAKDELNKDKDEIGWEKEPWCCVGYID
jgi:hypothetical protein